MNRKKLGLISAMVCLICVILAIYVNVASTRTIRVAGQEVKCRIQNRKLTVEDFEVFELNELNVHVHESDLKKQIGKPDGYLTKEIGEINQVGVGTMFYLLEDRRGVVPHFMNGFIYGLTLWKGDSRECILKAVDESDLRKVHYNGNDIEYVTRHRNLTAVDFENLELGTPLSEMVEKIGEQDALSRDSETGNRTMLFVLEDDKVAECYLLYDDETVYLEKIVIYDGDDVDLVIEDVAD
ncbi:MAG: hypothetical protein NC433_03825 [Clostridiales bacterium]|nr:hypothetical protein [Clostridiales bacterium]